MHFRQRDGAGTGSVVEEDLHPGPSRVAQPEPGGRTGICLGFILRMMGTQGLVLTLRARWVQGW